MDIKLPESRRDLNLRKREFLQIYRHINKRMPKYNKRTLEWVMQHPDEISRADYAVLHDSNLDTLSQLATKEEIKEKVRLGLVNEAEVKAMLVITDPVVNFVKMLLEYQSGIEIGTEKFAKMLPQRYPDQERQLYLSAQQVLDTCGNTFGKRLIGRIASDIDSAIDQVIEKRPKRGYD